MLEKLWVEGIRKDKGTVGVLKIQRLFQQKVRRAISSRAIDLLQGSVEVNETVVRGRESGVRGRKNEKKLLLVVIIERKARGTDRMHAQHLKNGGSKELCNVYSSDSYRSVAQLYPFQEALVRFVSREVGLLRE